MVKTNFFIGIDISSDYFTVTVITNPKTIIFEGLEFSNDSSGFKDFCRILKSKFINSHNSIICMENTGVYSEKISHHFYQNDFKIILEQPLKVKRAFTINEHKTDSIDSRQIAEYVYRFKDKVNLWQPRKTILEKLNTILNTRELFVKQKVAIQNNLTSLMKKEIIVKECVQLLKKSICDLQKKIDSLEKEMDSLIQLNQHIKHKYYILISAKGVGKYLALRLIIKTNVFDMKVNYKNLASNIGICPFKNQSGTSIKKRDRSKGVGDEPLRKLLKLASCSLVRKGQPYRQYFLRKIDDGKPKNLVLNNIANKFLKMLFALIQNDQEYILGYSSINPVCL